MWLLFWALVINIMVNWSHFPETRGISFSRPTPSWRETRRSKGSLRILIKDFLLHDVWLHLIVCWRASPDAWRGLVPPTRAAWRPPHGLMTQWVDTAQAWPSLSGDKGTKPHTLTHKHTKRERERQRQRERESNFNWVDSLFSILYWLPLKNQDIAVEPVFKCRYIR